MTEAPIRIMTWNIHGAIGPDRRFDLQRVIDLVRRHEPDIIALQEVDSRRCDLSPFERLAEALGDHSAAARTVIAPGGEYGHMLISRWPMAEARLHDLSIWRYEPRMAIETVIDTPLGPLHLVAAHLGLSLWERYRQASILGALARSSGQPMTTMLGDFNDWIWNGPVRRGLMRALPSYSSHVTFPSWAPALKLDRIYCGGEARLLRSWTDKAARKASDHLPIIGEIGRVT